jgi:AcrR family transcriptional regulator
VATHRRGEHVRQQVLRAAFDELAERGTAAGIPDVARRSGVHETTIYRRWGSKENLFVEAMLNSSTQAIPVPDTGTIRGDLTAIARAVRDYLASPAGIGASRAGALAIDDDYRESRKQFWARRFDALKPVIEHAIARGELRPHVDGRMLLEALVAPLHARTLFTGETAGDDFIAELVDLLLKGAQP